VIGRFVEQLAKIVPPSRIRRSVTPNADVNHREVFSRVHSAFQFLVCDSRSVCHGDLL